MNLTITVPDRLVRTPDGRTWAEGSCTYPIYAKHLAVFDGVRVVARLHSVENVPQRWQRVDGPQVDVVGLPSFVGPKEYLQRLPSVLRATRKTIRFGELPVLRLPAWHISGHIASYLQRRQYPFAVEVMGDAGATLSAGTNRFPLQSLVRRWVDNRTRRACQTAFAALYVTRKSLQRAYPANSGALTTACSDVSLPDDAYSPNARTFTEHSGAWKIVFIGSLEALRKGPDVLIEAFSRCLKNIQNIELTFIGEGRQQAHLMRLTESMGLQKHISFQGHLSAGKQVRDELDRSHLFVLASHSEGLPRSILEAMARGLPCIGSTAGGIPELLPADLLVPPGDSRTLASRILDVLEAPHEMEKMSQRNLLTARTYFGATLDDRRDEYYRAVRERFSVAMKGKEPLWRQPFI